MAENKDIVAYKKSNICKTKAAFPVLWNQVTYIASSAYIDKYVNQ